MQLQNKEWLVQNKKFILTGVILIVLCLAGLLYSTSRPTNIDRVPPNESNEIDYSDQAYVVDGANLLFLMESPEAYDSLSKDMYVFAKSAYEKYIIISDTVIGFEATKDIQKNGNLIEIEGRFGATKNKILITAELLNNNRIKTSITDTRTNLNIDNDLPSNTERNQFIGSLPIETTGYTIDYLGGEEDSFFVNVFNNAKNFTEAENVILESLNIESLEQDNVVRYGVGDRYEGAGF